MSFHNVDLATDSCDIPGCVGHAVINERELRGNDPIPFTVDHAKMLKEIHEILTKFGETIENLAPMLAQVATSPVGKMLGL